MALAVWRGRSPLNHPGLAAKLLALLAYIALGLIALRFARSATAAGVAYVDALICFAYTLAVAVTHDVWPDVWPSR